jgi:hypothetical protein
MDPFTSGTTNGICGSILQAEELSMTVQPAEAKAGAQAFEVAPPAENNATSGCMEIATSGVTTEYDLPRKEINFPADFSEATGMSSVTGKLRSANICNILLPTNPVAPTTATFML